ncbi:aldo/keto reductase [Candidatus Thioglobus sp.]|nr:aldo/keto reductase [Candidatus Thioglobus sp.]
MKIALGTAQFGFDYGVTNQSGQVAIDEVEKILNYAKSNGIDTLDTASGYGNSEQVLGNVGIDSYQIITKTVSIKNGVNKVIKGFYQSLKNLGKNSVDGILIHDINELDDKNFDNLFKQLDELKQNGLVNKIGFSTYTPKQVDFLLENFDFDIIQLPVNVFDNRLIKGGQLKALKNRDIEVHARSIFLQGVLLDFENLTGYFQIWKEQFGKYQIMVDESELSLLEYALNFALGIQEIDKILVGVNSENQLKDIIQASTNQHNLDAYPISDTSLLNPGLWK